jgi:hypothetical protein
MAPKPVMPMKKNTSIVQEFLQTATPQFLNFPRISYHQLAATNNCNGEAEGKPMSRS